MVTLHSSSTAMHVLGQAVSYTSCCLKDLVECDSEQVLLPY
jgi:hypothetical protein